MPLSFSIRFVKYSLLLVCFCFTLNSCDNTSQIEKDIAAIPMTVNIERFDKLLATASLETLPELKKKYPFIISKNVHDSIWIRTINDSLQQQLFDATQQAYSDNTALEADVTALFRHLKYYNKTFKAPRVITVTSEVEYRNKVIVTDSIALIALDTYLGEDHPFYANIPQYVSQNLKASQIASDLAEAYAKQYAFQSKKKTLLEEMIYHGKLLYFKDKVVPFLNDAERIGYTQDQLDWAIANENYIWRYFVERELLYNTDSKLPSRFINPSPFSKFYLDEIDNKSPGKIGQYIGWQIVRAYMNTNKVSLNDMMLEDAENLFNKSKYKPRK